MNTRKRFQRDGTAAPPRRSPLWLVAGALFCLSIMFVPRATVGGEAPPSVADAVAELESLQSAFESVVQKVTPSVIGIRAERRHISSLSDGEDSDLLEQRVVVNGSGTVIRADGMILTNEHVIQNASNIEVLLYDGTSVPATVVKADPRSDLAVLKVPRTDLTPARMCDWDRVNRGQWSIVVGNPFGLGSDGQLSVAIGVVSNLGRQLPGLGEVDDRFYNDMLQTTAPINPGHSGGPLFNIRGELIGVVTAMHTRAPADEGIGFAIPINPAKRRVIELLCQGQNVEYGYLGLTVRMPEEGELEANGLASGYGVVVDQVEPDGPCDQAGLRVGDIIRRFDHHAVTGPAQIADLVGQTPINTRVQLRVVRRGQPTTITARVARRDVSRVSWMRHGAVLWRGMRVADISDEAREIMELDADADGVLVIDVLPDSPASQAGIQIGHVIERISGHSVVDTADFLLQSRKTDGVVEVMVREYGRRFIAAE